MEILGEIIQLLPLQSGKSQRGEWQKQDFILETESQYPKKVCISVWNNKFDVVSLEGKKIRASIEVESREYNGKWYTDVKAWKIESLEQSVNNPAETPTELPPISSDDIPWNQGESDSDLPF